MKKSKLILVTAAILAITYFSPIPSMAGGKIDQAQLDSLAARLAERLESGSWIFTPSRFTGTNDICAEFYGTEKNRVTLIGDALDIHLNFIGARISSRAASPTRKVRAVATAAAAAKLNGRLPDRILTKGEVVEKNVIVGRKSKSISVDIRYSIEDTNIYLPSSTATARIYINTRDLSTSIVFYNMNMDGTMEGSIEFL